MFGFRLHPNSPILASVFLLLLTARVLPAQPVTTTPGLAAALISANANSTATTTITLAAGTYNLTADLPDLAANNLTLQGPTTGLPAIINATALASGVIFNITADHITIANLTLQNARNHALAIQPGADSGLIKDCAIDNPTLPFPATAAINGNNCLNWTVTGNRISNIVGTNATADPAIHFYGGASGTTINNNLILNCDRAIGFGGDAATFVPPTSIAPDITTQPQNAMVATGQAATFNVIATGTAPLSYQWRKSGTIISGATAASYTTPVMTTPDPGSYTVLVSNAAGGVTSSAVIATMIPVELSDRTFTLGVWSQQATDTINGVSVAYYYKNIGINTFAALDRWPTEDWAYPGYSLQTATILKEAGMKVFAGGDQVAVDWNNAHPEYKDIFVGYFLGDEPDMNRESGIATAAAANTPLAWKARGDSLLASDNTRMVYANFGKPFALDVWYGNENGSTGSKESDFADYVEPTSVISSDYYGITDPWESESYHGVWTYGRAVLNTRKYAGTRPVWGFVEASAPWGDTDNAGPNRHQMFRCMPPSMIKPIVWNMVVNGANGIVYFCHCFSSIEMEPYQNISGAGRFFPLLYPGMSDAMKEANESVMAFGAVLKTASISGTTVTTDGSVNVIALTKSFNGSTYIFAMGDGNATYLNGKDVDAEFTISGQTGSKRVEVLTDSRTITMSNGKFSDHFGPYELHIYKF